MYGACIRVHVHALVRAGMHSCVRVYAHASSQCLTSYFSSPKWIGVDVKDRTAPKKRAPLVRIAETRADIVSASAPQSVKPSFVPKEEKLYKQFLIQ